MLEFKKVTLEDSEILTPYLCKYGASSCQYSMYLMTGLSMKYGDEFAVSDGILYIHRSKLDTEGIRSYLAPLGDFNDGFEKAFSVLLEDAKEHSCRASVMGIGEEYAEKINTVFPGMFETDYSEDLDEYIYTTETLSVLSGKALAPKRNRVHAFYSQYEGHVRIENICEENLLDVILFQKEWIKDRLEEEYDEMLDREDKAITFYLSHYDELKFTGIVVYVWGSVAGYAAGVSLNDDCMDEVIEKGRKDITGIYQLLCNEFAILCCKGYTYINREEDLGIEGLRRAKRSYHPERMIKKYTVTEKEN